MLRRMNHMQTQNWLLIVSVVYTVNTEPVHRHVNRWAAKTSPVQSAIAGAPDRGPGTSVIVSN